MEPLMHATIWLQIRREGDASMAPIMILIVKLRCIDSHE